MRSSVQFVTSLPNGFLIGHYLEGADAQDSCGEPAVTTDILNPGVRLRMHRTLTIVALVAMTTSPLAAQRSQVSSLSWLAGCWQMRSGGATIEEQWMGPRANSMMGMGRTTRGDSVVSAEFVRIYSSPRGLVYAASPLGQTPAEFVVKSTGAREIVFENPRADFPQRIMYRAVGRDSLTARIEGTIGGQLRGQSFSYRRVRCGD